MFMTQLTGTVSLAMARPGAAYDLDGIEAQTSGADGARTSVEYLQ